MYSVIQNKHIHQGNRWYKCHILIIFPLPSSLSCISCHLILFDSFNELDLWFIIGSWVLYCLYSLYFINFLFVFLISFFLLASDLKCSCLSRMLRCIIRLFIWVFFFSVCILTVTLLLITDFIVSDWLWYILPYCHLILNCSISLLVSSMIHWLFNNVLFDLVLA